MTKGDTLTCVYTHVDTAMNVRAVEIHLIFDDEETLEK